MHKRSWILVPLIAACAGGAGGPGDVRFVNRDVVQVVNDRCHVEQKPAEYNPGTQIHAYDAALFRRFPRGLAFDAPLRSRSQNSLDEVPDSTWFTNRIGVRDMSVAEIQRGPNTSDGPDRSAPWKVIGSKTAGVAIGFRIEDAKKDVYLIKFDQQHLPEMETAAEVIVQRLVWAFGYNVPENSMVFFDRKQLHLADDAEMEDQFGNKRRMTAADLEFALGQVAVEKNGQYRAVASRYIGGQPIGGISPEGVRASDPNDSIPHELRRELRGQYALYAWLNNVDVKPGNTLDSFMEDPRRKGHHYVVHHMIDFGKALGVHANDSLRGESGHMYTAHPERWLANFLSLGFQRYPWEYGEPVPAVVGVARFTSKNFEPHRWKPLLSWVPFSRADRFDNYWGTKILVRFRPEHIRAAVEQGEFSDPRATEHYVRVLIERQRKTALHWFSQVAPLEAFEVRSQQANAFQLCFQDLLIAHGLDDKTRTTRYSGRSYDFEGRPAGLDLSAGAGAEGRTCLSNVPAHEADDGYTIVELKVFRGDDALPPIYVHLARGEGGRLRVIGVWRT